MEFILVSQPNIGQLQVEWTTCIRQAPRLAPVDGGISCVASDDTLLIGAGLTHCDGGDIVCWDGHGIARGGVFSSGGVGAFRPADILDYLGALEAHGDIGSVRGIFCCVTFEPKTGRYRTAIDPMQQYPLFQVQTEETLIVSNSIYWVESALKFQGRKPIRSTLAGALEIAFGVGADSLTGVQGVHLLPHGTMLCGDKQGREFKPVSPNDHLNALSYEGLLNLSKQRLKDYVSRIAEGRRSLFDLTGGIDSRICLAAALGAGLTELETYCSGDDASDDKRISKHINKIYNLGSGQYPDTMTAQISDDIDRARTATFRQQGHSNLYHYDLGIGRTSTVARIRGGAGELTRFYRPAPESNRLFWDKPIKNLGRILLLNPSYLAILSAYFRGPTSGSAKRYLKVADQVSSKSRRHNRIFRWHFLYSSTLKLIDQIAQCETDHPDLSLALYARDRCKRHFGFISRMLNVSCSVFEPLCDPVIYRASAALSDEDRKNGKFAFDLISGLGGRRLLEVPFSRGSLDDAARQFLDTAYGIGDLSSVVRDEAPAIAGAGSISESSSNTVRRDSLPENLGDHGKYLWHNREYLKALILKQRNERWFKDCFKADYILSSLDEDGLFFSSEAFATKGLRLLHTLIWLANEELKGGITSEYTIKDVIC